MSEINRVNVAVGTFIFATEAARNLIIDFMRQQEAEIKRLRELLTAARAILQHHKATYPDEIDDELDHQGEAPDV